MDRTKRDIIYFEDGTPEIKRKEGYVSKVENGLIYFSEYGKMQLIPVVRIIRIEKGDNGYQR